MFCLRIWIGSSIDVSIVLLEEGKRSISISNRFIRFFSSWLSNKPGKITKSELRKDDFEILN